jgi:hypothetical protein
MKVDKTHTAFTSSRMKNPSEDIISIVDHLRRAATVADGLRDALGMHMETRAFQRKENMKALSSVNISVASLVRDLRIRGHKRSPEQVQRNF